MRFGDKFSAQADFGGLGMISVQIAISRLSRAGITAYLSQRRDHRLIIKCKANDILSSRSFAVLDGFISERALNSVLFHLGAGSDLAQLPVMPVKVA